MKLSFSKEMYPKVALLKAAYAFTDRAYLHLDADLENYYVDISPKNAPIPDLEQLFENEMLCQSVRHEIYLQTRTIRELLTARAIASTVVELPDSDPSKVIAGAAGESDILTDWFEKNEHSVE